MNGSAYDVPHSSRPGRVIVVTGPPGAGKSTVSGLLAAELSPSVHLSADDFYAYIRRGWLAPYLPQAHRQNETVIDVVAQAAFGYAAGGYQVICDGVVGPWFIDVFRAAAAARELPLHYVVLRPDEATTLDRAVGRTSEALTDPEPIRSLHRQFTGIGAFEEHVLDSTRLDPRATVNAVVDGLTAGAYRLTALGTSRPSTSA